MLALQILAEPFSVAAENSGTSVQNGAGRYIWP